MFLPRLAFGKWILQPSDDKNQLESESETYLYGSFLPSLLTPNHVQFLVLLTISKCSISVLWPFARHCRYVAHRNVHMAISPPRRRLPSAAAGESERGLGVPGQGASGFNGARLGSTPGGFVFKVCYSLFVCVYMVFVHGSWSCHACYR